MGLFKKYICLLVILILTIELVTSAWAPLHLAEPIGKIPNSYIVVLKDNCDEVDLSDVIARVETQGRLFKFDLKVTDKYVTVFRGFALEISERFISTIRSIEKVDYIQEDNLVEAQQGSIPWNLDRIDQRDLPLDGVYNPAGDGTGVSAYVVDTGIRYSHIEFNGRASSFYDYESGDGSDCNGHGTHGAGVVAGQNYGVAKNAQLYSVRVLNCIGSGSTSMIVGGLDYIATNGNTPGVASLAIGGGPSTALDNAARGVIAAGIQLSIAAGGGGTSACNFSPARIAEGITVGGTDSGDNIASSSNTGPCVDVFAPSVSITSAWHTTDTDYRTLSGTSSAAAHAAGVLAIILQDNPNLTSQEVKDQLLGDATAGRLNNVPADTANLLVHTSA
ncbi:aqualysin-1-like [Ptychodera flava]|uniref:aqualysin-1-like n=1 Tax=Ptychodera flava TaxID=63121 RepID=UPI00396A3941